MRKLASFPGQNFHILKLFSRWLTKLNSSDRKRNQQLAKGWPEQSLIRKNQPQSILRRVQRNGDDRVNTDRCCWHCLVKQTNKTIFKFSALNVFVSEFILVVEDFHITIWRVIPYRALLECKEWITFVAVSFFPSVARPQHPRESPHKKGLPITELCNYKVTPHGMPYMGLSAALRCRCFLYYDVICFQEMPIIFFRQQLRYIWTQELYPQSGLAGATCWLSWPDLL